MDEKIVEVMAKAIKESTDSFQSPVPLYIEGEARRRWERESPDGEWYDTAESRDELVDYKIIARDAWDAAKVVLAEAGFVIVPQQQPRQKETFAEEVRRLRSEISQRQLWLQYLVCGDPGVRVTVPVAAAPDQHR